MIIRKAGEKLKFWRITVKVNVKKLHPKAVIPSYAKAGDAGMDLTAVEISIHQDYGYYEYNTGLAFEIPEGYVGYVFPRSSISKYSLNLCNAVGVIDSGYRGPVMLRFNRDNNSSNVEYLPGDKVGQLVIMPVPTIELTEVEELSTTERGAGGFGSSGS